MAFYSIIQVYSEKQLIDSKMLNDWLSFSEILPCPYKSFRLIDVAEKAPPSTDLKSFLGKEILTSYRNMNFLKMCYQSVEQRKLIEYINANMFPSEDNTISKNVKQGDFGEILASLVVSYFQGLIVPIHKMRWKFNKDRSVFCTDMIAHNAGDEINDIHYYEVKSRLNIRKENSNYITVNAHNSLLKDEQTPNEGIADYLARYFFEKGDYLNAKKYSEIVIFPEKYNRKFELFFIIEQSEFLSEILKDLEDLPPSLNPLCVTVVLINNLRNIIEETYDKAIASTIDYVYS